MAGYLRAPATPGTLRPAQQVAYCHTNAGWGNADLAVVTFGNEWVIKRGFLPD